MSRPRSGRSSVLAGRASASRPGVFVQAPRSDVYVALLGVALGAMIVGCILLALILQRYDFKTKVSALMPAVPAANAAATEQSPPLNRGVLHT
jgi:hypothetical protein